ncbi:MAG TPA: response regulator transcription factor [Opitutaceae bacterium]|jgi:DNA-binding NarL/FixJ family response regulator
MTAIPQGLPPPAVQGRRIKVLLAEDHVVVRQGLRSLLVAEPDIEVVGEASNGRQAVQMSRELKPDIVVMDIGMPLLNGLEATSQIIGDGAMSRVLILSSYADDEYVHHLAEAGASGYLVKQTASADLITAVRQIAKGNAYFSPSILKRLLELYRETSAKGRPAAGLTEPLTSREQEVLQMVAEGHVNKQIAAALNLSIKTVEKHRQQLMDKLNIHDIAGLTRYAISHGVVESTSRINCEPDAKDNSVQEAAPH